MAGLSRIMTPHVNRHETQRHNRRLLVS